MHHVLEMGRGVDLRHLALEDFAVTEVKQLGKVCVAGARHKAARTLPVP